VRIVGAEQVVRYEVELDAAETAQLRALGQLPAGCRAAVTLPLTANEICDLGMRLNYSKLELSQILDALEAALRVDVPRSTEEPS